MGTLGLWACLPVPPPPGPPLLSFSSKVANYPMCTARMGHDWPTCSQTEGQFSLLSKVVKDILSDSIMPISMALTTSQWQNQVSRDGALRAASPEPPTLLPESAPHCVGQARYKACSSKCCNWEVGRATSPKLMILWATFLTRRGHEGCGWGINFVTLPHYSRQVAGLALPYSCPQSWLIHMPGEAPLCCLVEEQGPVS